MNSSVNLDTRNQWIIGLAKRGVRPRKIAIQAGLSDATVSCVLKRARKYDDTIPVFGSGSANSGTRYCARITLTEGCRLYLKSEADKRNQSVEALLNTLVDMIITDKMVPAILDDGDPT